MKTTNDAWNVEENRCRWMVGSINYPCIRDIRFYEQMNLVEDYQKEIQANWGPQKEEYGTGMPGVVLTAEENDEFSDIMADVKTYVSECTLKFIRNEMSLDEWDSFTDNIEKMNIGKALEIQQAAVDRFNSRQ